MNSFGQKLLSDFTQRNLSNPNSLLDIHTLTHFLPLFLFLKYELMYFRFNVNSKIIQFQSHEQPFSQTYSRISFFFFYFFRLLNSLFLALSSLVVKFFYLCKYIKMVGCLMILKLGIWQKNWYMYMCIKTKQYF